MAKRLLHPLEKILENRIAIIDGAMGTTIRTYGMKETDIRGDRFKDSTKDLLNNGDIFSLTQPKMIGDIHRRFLEAGADIIETNTFGATSITQSEFFVDDPREHGGRKDPGFYEKVIHDPFLRNLAWEINEQSARQCRKWADRVGNETSRQRFVAGAIGPLTVSLSNSPDADDAGFRVVTFRSSQRLPMPSRFARSSPGESICFSWRRSLTHSTPRRPSSLFVRSSMQDGKDLPVMISAAVGRGGETLISAQTTEAFWNAVRHVKPLSVGLNCSLGPDLMYPFLSELSEKADVAISCYPNAGLPNPLSETGFDLGPHDMARFLGELCEGRTDQHSRRLLWQHPGAHRCNCQSARGPAAAEVGRGSRRERDCGVSVTDINKVLEATENKPLRLSGSQPFTQQAGVYIMIGERTNVAGSPKFAKTRQGRQVRRSRKHRPPASRERRERHRHLHGRRHDRRRRRNDALPSVAGSEPEVAKVPFMVDSSKWEVIEAGLKCLQGKGIVNSISLKEGEEKFRQNAATVLKYGAAVVVMAFDEKGQAATYDEKIRICERAYRILVDEVGFPPEDIIFDPNILTVGTGMEEHNNYAVDFIDATRWIKANLPHAKVSGGVSNVSFSFRGNNTVREAMHARFCFTPSRRAWTWASSTPACSRSTKK